MMYPRLVLLKQFLRDDGVIFVSIDDAEVAMLRLLMDEVFGASKFVAQLVWKSRQNKDNRNTTNVSIDHEYVLCYGRKLRGSRRDETQYSNPDNDPRGPWSSANMVGLADEKARPNLHYDLIDPETGISYDKPAKGWRYDRNTMSRLMTEGKVIFPPTPTGRPRKKQFLAELMTEFTGYPSIVGTACYTNDGTKELIGIFGESPFDFPKNTKLLMELIEQATDKNSIILDSFGGSGTTAHAVLKQNAEDGGNRRFILVEMDEGIARDVTAERVRRVAQGYTNAKGEKIEGLGGSFQFCRIGKDLFDPRGHIDKDVRFAELANFVWFMETGMGLPPARASKRKADTGNPLLGVHDGRAVYLLYNGILKDRSIDGGNTLTTPLLEQLPPHDGPRVIYAARCAIGEARLRSLDITFRKLPYDLRVTP